MGYLTEVVVYNDALHEFEKDPEGFGKAVFEAIREANRENKQVSVPFKGYCNYIAAEKSRHADHTCLFLHNGNMLHVVGQYEQDWEELVQKQPDLAKSMIEKAESIIKAAKQALKKKTK